MSKSTSGMRKAGSNERIAFHNRSARSLEGKQRELTAGRGTRRVLFRAVRSFVELHFVLTSTRPLGSVPVVTHAARHGIQPRSNGPFAVERLQTAIGLEQRFLCQVVCIRLRAAERERNAADGPDVRFHQSLERAGIGVSSSLQLLVFWAQHPRSHNGASVTKFPLLRSATIRSFLK